MPRRSANSLRTMMLPVDEPPVSLAQKSPPTGHGARTQPGVEAQLVGQESADSDAVVLHSRPPCGLCASVHGCRTSAATVPACMNQHLTPYSRGWQRLPLPPWRQPSGHVLSGAGAGGTRHPGARLNSVAPLAGLVSSVLNHNSVRT